MYYPYFRGKQYDLITIKENAALLATNKFVPIIEPVKQALSGLVRAIEAINEAKGQLILIVNPINGDHSENSEAISDLLLNEFKDQSKIHAGVLLTEGMTVLDAVAIYKSHISRKIAFVHAGFSEGKLLGEHINETKLDCMHVFVEEQCGKLYRRHLSGRDRVLLRDGFNKRPNRAHPPTEFFSDLHLVYEEEGMNGFGDFLIVGDEFSETGGPAYAVAIHMTFIKHDKDDEMHIHHFKSDRFDTPADPAGKFAEALLKLNAEATKKNPDMLQTNAVKEFLDLHRRGHFPGLGYVKKLSMQHHLETLANYFSSAK
jgi:hypothetical protein